MPEALEFPLVADLPENWIGANAITPNGTEAGLTPKHGYNYLMSKVNEALRAANELQEAIDNFDPGGSITIPEADKLVAGIVRIATLAEVLAGESINTVVTPESLFELLENAETVIVAATEAKRGIIRIASEAEVVAGEATDIAVTPATLQAKVDSIPSGGNSMSWMQIPIPTSGKVFSAVCFSEEQLAYVAVGNNGAIAESSDGTTWYDRSKSTITIHFQALCWSKEKSLWVAVGQNGIVTSPDRSSWTVRTCPNAVYVGVCWSKEKSLFVAVGQTSNIAATSPDGITWTARTLPTAPIYHQVCWSAEKSLFVIAGARIAATSPDGITWTARTLPTGFYLGICWSAEKALFVITGSSVAATSPDGITWTERVLSSSNIHGLGNFVSWEAETGKFISVNSEAMAVSDDVVDWKNYTLPWPHNAHCICWSKYRERYLCTRLTCFLMSQFNIPMN